MLEIIKQKWDSWVAITPANALYDRTLLWVYFLLLSIGLIAVTSASADLSQEEILGLASKQITFVLLSISAVLLISQIPMWFLENKKVVWATILLTLGLMILTLIIGKKVNGAVRWIQFGPINFQASELAKLVIIGYMASYCSRQYERIFTRPFSIFYPGLVVGIFILLFWRQSDTGSLVIATGLMIAMLLLAGIRIMQFLFIIPFGLVAFWAYIGNADYRLNRFIGFLDPFGTYQEQGLQQSESLFAISSGGLNGVGLGSSIGKLNNLPEKHTDFIMAIIGEEFGFLGLFVIMLLVLLLSFRIFKIAFESFQLTERYKGFFAFGVGLWIFGQSFANLGVMSSLLPAKGLTFPFVSYGGSSILVMSIAIAIVLRIDYENRFARIGSAKRKA